jgi:voltage-gated sodium channel type IV alpha
MTKKQLEWVDIMRMIVKAKPDLETTNVPKGRFLQILHSIVTSTAFDVFIMICIVLNMVQMGLTYEGESAEYTLTLLVINYIFTTIFLIEAIMKLIAFRRSYFHSSWNVFDFIVVIGSLVDIVLTNMNATQLSFLRVGPQLVRVLRVLRVSRLLRLINKYPGLQALIKTIMFSLPSLLSVFLLLMLIFFIFAILGVFIFNEVKSGDVIDDYVNFGNFGNAMIM